MFNAVIVSVIKKILLFTFYTLLSFSVIGQISGTVYDEKGETLPSVSIFVKGTSIGTTTNLDGKFRLSVLPGTHVIVFQYIGMTTHEETIQMESFPVVLNVALKSQAVELKEVVIRADVEDPAYRIIRKAIEKRAYYRDLIRQFTCDVYIKGNNKILSAPEKIFGREIGDFEGRLDTNRQGIIYLSESISKLHFRAPDDLKEVVVSSKVSGDNQGYSFNSAREMEFNPYDNTMEFNRQLVSPISSNAFAYYRYRLEGTFYDNDGHLINKIRLLPKLDTDPCFYGHIYIIEDLWNIHSVDLGLTAKASQFYFIDSLTINQIFIPIKEPDVWRIFSSNMTFVLAGFGFKLKGTYTANYSNYDLNPEFKDNFFNREVFIVDEASNKKDSTYWESSRPTPLTVEEQTDYYRKDSIQTIHDSPAYKDSMDRKSNRWDVGNILSGYEHKNSVNHSYWNIESPIEHLGYNTVQGLNAHLDIKYRKYFDEKETRRMYVNTSLVYGFAEKDLRANASVTYRPDRLSGRYIFLQAGRDIVQYGKFVPVDEFRNTIYNLLFRRNYAKYYDYNRVKIGLGHESKSGHRFSAVLGYEARNPLTNHTDYSLFYKNTREFTVNDPVYINSSGTDPPTYFAPHRVMSAEVYADLRIKQEYFVYPDRKFSLENKGPEIQLKYRLLIGLDNDIRLHALSGLIAQQFSSGAVGKTSIFMETGGIISQNQLTFMDYYHFRGNQFVLSKPSDYDRSFLLLPLYSHSTDGAFFQAHVHHNFEGFLLGKIPGIRNLGFSLVAGAKYLYAEGHDHYAEVHLGLDNIGIHMFRILRFDFVLGVDGGRTEVGYRIGIKI